MATKIINKHIYRHVNFTRCLILNRQCRRTLLSNAYFCDERWEKRLESPFLKNIKMAQYFMEVDKKFQTKRLASGVDIDLFANKVIEDLHLDELEHLVHRFRKTKRSVEMLDSTHYAIVRALLKFQNFETLFRILRDRVDYGVFPDLISYNLLMSTFLKLNQYRDSTEIATLMMLQEDFSNPISRILALYSCQKYIDSDPQEPWPKYIPQKEEQEEVETTQDDDEDEDEEKFIRVPFIRNAFFDDHFDIKDHKALIGKTLYLNGREEGNTLGRTYQLIGLAMQQKWEKASQLLNQQEELADSVFFREGIEKFKVLVSEVANEEEKKRLTVEFGNQFETLEKKNKLIDGMIKSLEEAVSSLKALEVNDINTQNANFLKWESLRQSLLKEQEIDIDKERRLKAIEDKKNELYWKEKHLFFFENEEEMKDEEAEVDKIIEELTTQTSAEETYIPPQMVKKKPLRISKYRRLAMVKTLSVINPK